jgi:hypothetical protein
MRNGSHRFWPCIAAAVAVIVIAVPAASAGVHKYNTKQYITHEGGAIGPAPAGYVFWEGGVHSKVKKCMEGRRVVLVRKRSGADRKIGTARTVWKYGRGDWGLNAPRHGRVYAEVRRKVLEDGDVCRAAPRSRTVRNGAPIEDPHPF